MIVEGERGTLDDQCVIAILYVNEYLVINTPGQVYRILVPTMKVDGKPRVTQGLLIILPAASAVVHMSNIPVSFEGWLGKIS